MARPAEYVITKTDWKPYKKKLPKELCKITGIDDLIKKHFTKKKRDLKQQKGHFAITLLTIKKAEREIINATKDAKAMAKYKVDTKHMKVIEGVKKLLKKSHDYVTWNMKFIDLCLNVENDLNDAFDNLTAALKKTNPKQKDEVAMLDKLVAVIMKLTLVCKVYKDKPGGPGLKRHMMELTRIEKTGRDLVFVSNTSITSCLADTLSPIVKDAEDYFAEACY